MTAPNEPTKPQRGACPNCGSRNLRRVREREDEAVVVSRRGCRDCGTVFSPAVSPLLLLVTVPLALGFLGVAAWCAFFNDQQINADMVDMVGWISFLGGLCLVGATVQIVRQREPKIVHTPRGPREAKPWDNLRGEE